MDKVEEESRGEKERAKERREGGGSLGKTGRGGYGKYTDGRGYFSFSWPQACSGEYNQQLYG